MDLSNVGLGQFWKVKNYVQQASHLSQNYYPESASPLRLMAATSADGSCRAAMGKFYIINAPYLFSTVWSWVKPWLDEVTVKKIAILGYDFRDRLLDQIPADSLPSSLGGQCDCEGGCSMSDQGPWKSKELIKKTRGVRSSTLTRTISGGPEAEVAKEMEAAKKAKADAPKSEPAAEKAEAEKPAAPAPSANADGAAPEKKPEVNGDQSQGQVKAPASTAATTEATATATTASPTKPVTAAPATAS